MILGITTRRGFLVYLTIVMTALYVLRVAFGDAPVNSDVREQLGFIGAWNLGYGSGANPPLFTWLAKLALAVIGKPVAAMELVRFLALWLACVFTWLAARRLLALAPPALAPPAATPRREAAPGRADERLAALAGLAPFSSLMLGWEAVFRYSNTTMLAMSVAFTFYALVRLDQRPVLASYLLLGAAIGVGLMSKLNYAVFLVALAAGALGDAALRSRLRDWRSVATLGVAAAIVSPFLVWYATRSNNVLAHGHQRMTLSPSYDHLQVPVPVSLMLDVVVGVAGIGLPLLIFVALLVPLAFRPGWAVATGDVRRYQRCLAVHLAVMPGLILAGLVIFEVTRLQVHYFFVFGLLIMLTMLRVAAANPSGARLRVFGTVVAAMPAVVVIGALVRGLTYGG